MEQDIVTRFWKEYTKSDTLERRNMLYKTGITIQYKRELQKETNEKLRKALVHSFVIILQSYFDDIINYIERRERDETRRKRTKKL